MTNDFNPNGAADQGSGVFGFPYSMDESELILIPVPWEATCSYGGGASNSPNYIFDASMFVELYDGEFGDFYSRGIYWSEQNEEIKALSNKAQKAAKPLIDAAGRIEGSLQQNKDEVDEMCKEMNIWVENTVLNYGKNKLVGLVGGDHSISLGAIKALNEIHDSLGVLQIDAHCDLRTSFESLKYSHASVFDNVLNETDVSKIVQVGVRGYCQEEYEKTQNSNNRITTFFDADLVSSTSNGVSWHKTCQEIISQLPENVYVSCDIDGLTPENCPNTGTPMPGGIEYSNLIYLLRLLSKKRKIIGFDLVEVSCDEKNGESWDAIVAANLLYKLCACCITSN